MNLDTTGQFAALDTQNMLAHIDALPAQLETAWESGSRFALPSIHGVQRILIAGMGGSAIGADLLAAYITPLCRLPVTVHRDYDLPAWASGSETLVICSSHSGNTEETLSAFNRAVENHCTLAAISTGGKLKALAAEHGIPWWSFVHQGQPRAAVGFSFGLLLSLFARLGLIPDQAALLRNAIEELRTQQNQIGVSVPVVKNAAKRMAGQLYGRWVVVLGAGVLQPVARRWKGQVSEVAKAWGQFEFLPEADHNTLAGLMNPAAVLDKAMVLFYGQRRNHPRNQQRLDLTRQVMMEEGLNTDFIDARGSTPLAQMWTSLHFGDYVSYYLAMMYDADPTPIPAIEGFKELMK